MKGHTTPRLTSSSRSHVSTRGSFTSRQNLEGSPDDYGNKRIIFPPGTAEEVNRYRNWDNRMMGELKRSVDASMKNLSARGDSAQRIATDSERKISNASSCYSTPKKIRGHHQKTMSSATVLKLAQEQAKKNFSPAYFEDSSIYSMSVREKETEAGDSDSKPLKSVESKTNKTKYFMKEKYESPEHDKKSDGEFSFSFGKELLQSRNNSREMADSKSQPKKTGSTDVSFTSLNMLTEDSFEPSLYSKSKKTIDSRRESQIENNKKMIRKAKSELPNAEEELSEVEMLKHRLEIRDRQVHELMALIMSIDQNLVKASQINSKERALMMSLRQSLHSGLGQIHSYGFEK